MVAQECILCGQLTVHEVCDIILDQDVPLCRRCFEMSFKYDSPQKLWEPGWVFPPKPVTFH